MSYPESANVSSGDATLATHYNNLRADAVHLGQVAADSVALGTLLERYVTRLAIERLDTTKLRVPASASAPVSLLIDGYLCQAVANVDLAAGEVPSGAANVFYIFANRSGASTTFTLTVSLTSTEVTDKRRIGRFYWDGSAIVKDSIRTDFADHLADLLYFVDPQICDGRLTLSTGVPAPVSDISSSANVYFTPYLGGRIALYVQDYGWRLYSFSELTLDISGVADAKNIDVWVYDDAGTLTLAYTEWSNDTLRATALVRQDGVLVKTGALGYRYLGTVRTSGAGVSCDTLLKRFVWNFYNRTIRPLQKLVETDSWTYGTATWRQWNADTDNKVEFVIGVDEDMVHMDVLALFNRVSGYAYGYIGVCLDNTNASDSTLKPIGWSSTNNYNSTISIFNGFAGIGYHYLALVEYAWAANVVYAGDIGIPANNQAGCAGWMKG